jgi:hypothetical protein
MDTVFDARLFASNIGSRRPDLVLTPDEVISRGLRRRPYPAKTTRHLLHGGVEYRCDVALAELRPAARRLDDHDTR